MYGELPFFDARAVDIPAGSGKKLSILIILPNKKDGLAHLDKKIRSFQLISTLENKLKKASVDLSIPRFYFDDRWNLNTTLQKVQIHFTILQSSEFLHNILW